MTEKKNKTPIESLSGYGGVRALQKKLERSTTVAANREAVAHSLLCIANATVMDVMSWDENGVFGMLDIADQSDRPSVIGINVKAPDIIDNDES